MEKYNLNYLQQLEAESIYIIREAFAEFKNPVMLYSIGKDSSVMLHLAQKAFYPGKIPFFLLHIDTGYKFKEMIEFRDYYTKKIGANLIVHKNKESKAKRLGPESAHTDLYIYYKKTKPLLETIKKYNFDAAFGGSRREEEKSRAKERIFSIRKEMGSWDPKNQRPELWHLYNSKLNKDETMRIFPLSNWTEADIWAYIQEEKIEIVPLYFAQKRKVVKRNKILIRLDEFTKPKKGEEVLEIVCRYRTLGCSPSTGAVVSQATSIEEILKEVVMATQSERETRAIDGTSDSAMESKKKEGYF
ncbi:MAG: sulfate adenylyltransferase subunit CysD [Candidatus Andersenbacteria bacterium]|nr:sulfate adenylyltransferase subunit CysD [Candidatus Andersenbacteria bacterium]